METITSNVEISKLFTTGKRASNKYISFIFQPSLQHGQPGRVAFIAGKKLGNAVWRNSAKRRMRELYKAIDGEYKNFDILFIAKSSILNETYSKVLSTCDETLKNIHG